MDKMLGELLVPYTISALAVLAGLCGVIVKKRRIALTSAEGHFLCMAISLVLIFAGISLHLSVITLTPLALWLGASVVSSIIKVRQAAKR